MNDYPFKNFSTSCKDCVFAVWEGDTNTDCSLGRIEGFEKNGAHIHGVDDGSVKYLTVDRFCNACHQKESVYLRGVPQEEWSQKIAEVVRVRCAVVVYLNDRGRILDLKMTLESIVSFEIQPTYLVVVIDSNSLVSAPQVMRTIRESKIACGYQVVAMEEADDTQITIYGDLRKRAIDEAVRQIDPNKHTYYMVLNAGYGMDSEFLSRLDRAINEEMIPVAAVTNHMDEVLVVQTALHNHNQILGNRGTSIINKLKWAVEQHGVRVLSEEELPL